MHAGLCFNFMHFCSTASLHRLIGDVHLPTVIVFSVIRILFGFFFLVFKFLFVFFCKSIFTHLIIFPGMFIHYTTDWSCVCLEKLMIKYLWNLAWYLNRLSVVLDSLLWWGVADLFTCCSIFLCQISSALTVLVELKTSVRLRFLLIGFCENACYLFLV